MSDRVKPLPARDSDAYLRRLGERVRILRSQRGMTRKALAQHARISERYLAQMEIGKGNVSIVLLRRIARAIGMPVTQLVHEGAEPPLDFVLLAQFLERLSPAELAEARGLLTEHFRAAPPPTATGASRSSACAAAANPRSASCWRNDSACPSSNSTARSSGAAAHP